MTAMHLARRYDVTPARVRRWLADVRKPRARCDGCDGKPSAAGQRQRAECQARQARGELCACETETVQVVTLRDGRRERMKG